MKQLPKALDRNGDLWVPAVTKHLVFRALQDAKQALAATQGMQAADGTSSVTVDHSQELRNLALVEELLGLDRLDRALPAVHEQLGQPTEQQSRLLRNLSRLRAV